MAMWELAAVRNNYELRLLENVIQGRQANERLAKAFESQAIQSHVDISPLVASRDRMNNGMGALSVAMLEANETLGALLSVVDSGFADMAYQQRLANEQLLEILQVLQAPLDTQAKELRRRAEEAYRNGWIDDARQDFKESEQLNRYDFTVHHALGTIAFAHDGNREVARNEFALAAQYARPKSAVDSAYALVALASVEEAMGALRDALGHSDEAVNVGQGTCPEAYYARARYTLATAGSRDAALEDLEAAFWGNPALVVASMSDHILTVHTGSRDEALGRFRDGLAKQVSAQLMWLEGFAADLATHSWADAPSAFGPIIDDLKLGFPKVRELQARNSIADYLEALWFVGANKTIAPDAARSHGQKVAAELRQKADSLRSRDANRHRQAQTDTRWTQTSFRPWAIGGGAVGTLVYAMGTSGFTNGVGDFFVGGFWGAIAGMLLRVLAGIYGAASVEYSDRADPQIARLEATASAIGTVVSGF